LTTTPETSTSIAVVSSPIDLRRRCFLIEGDTVVFVDLRRRLRGFLQLVSDFFWDLLGKGSINVFVLN
jgi:hypothetical protein